MEMPFVKLQILINLTRYLRLLNLITTEKHMSIEIKNPANPKETVAYHSENTAEEIDTIITNAKSAQKKWATVPQPERGRIIKLFLDALETKSEEIALSMTKEMGKTLGESKGEIAKAVGEGRATADRAGAAIGEVLPSQIAGTISYTFRRPRGVVLGINPWNFPFSTPLRKAIPALLYGNAIIQKPATISPGPLLMMRDIASDFFPKGLFDVVVGGGAIGQSLCEHQDINAVSFTGSVNVGRKVAIAAVSHFAEVSLELGGKNPVIVNDSLNLDAALDQITAAGFAVCGQRCTAISRVIVHTDLEAQVIEGLAKRANAIIPSDGTKDDAQMGPLSSDTQLHDVSGFVERAINEGAKIAAGGTKINSDTGGFFYSPTILSGVTRNMEIARNEVFGPVMVVMSYSNIEEALFVANDVSFGLSSCLYSDQLHVVERFIAESESGMLHINGGSFPQNHLPFVGVKESALGVGGSNGASTIQFYTTEHTVYKNSLT